MTRVCVKRDYETRHDDDLKMLNIRKFLQFNFGTIKSFRLPDLGEKIKDATISEWFVKEGDIVE